MNILITGAASGIGRALAWRLARAGVSLYLTDRNAHGLDVTAAECRTRGAESKTHVLDVRDRIAIARWIDIPTRIDLLFICAGITGGRPAADNDSVAIEPAERVHDMLDINLLGALNAMLPAIARMRRQTPDAKNIRGRIGVMASVAGFVSYTGTPSYCASKAALDRFTVAQASSLASHGITLTSVCCGFVDTPMVAGNRFPMPGIVSAATAARRVLRGTLRGRRRVIFPWWLVIGARMGDLLPPALMERYYRRQHSAQPGGMPDS